MANALISRVLEPAGIPYDLVELGEETSILPRARNATRVRCVVLRVDDGFVAAVVKAGSHVDLEWFLEVSGAQSVMLADARERRDLFPGCEAGAEPPFGLPVWVDEGVTREERIAFPAGSFDDVVRIEYPDFERAVSPTVARFARP